MTSLGSKLSIEQSNAISGLILKTRSLPRGSIVLTLGEDFSPFDCAIKAMSNLSEEKPMLFVVASEALVDNGTWLDAINDRTGAEELFDQVKIIATQNGKISPSQLQRIGNIDFVVLTDIWSDVSPNILNELFPNCSEHSIFLVSDFLNNAKARELVQAFEKSCQKNFDYKPIDSTAVIFGG